MQERIRNCTNPIPDGGRDCRGLGADSETRTCNTQPCPGEYLQMCLIGFQYYWISLGSLFQNSRYEKLASYVLDRLPILLDFTGITISELKI
jgi:hypothetical protein